MWPVGSTSRRRRSCAASRSPARAASPLIPRRYDQWDAVRRCYDESHLVGRPPDKPPRRARGGRCTRASSAHDLCGRLLDHWPVRRGHPASGLGRLGGGAGRGPGSRRPGHRRVPGMGPRRRCPGRRGSVRARAAAQRPRPAVQPDQVALRLLADRPAPGDDRRARRPRRPISRMCDQRGHRPGRADPRPHLPRPRPACPAVSDRRAARRRRRLHRYAVRGGRRPHPTALPSGRRRPDQSGR